MQSNFWWGGGKGRNKKSFDWWLVFQVHLSNVSWEYSIQEPGLQEIPSRTQAAHSGHTQASVPAALIYSSPPTAPKHLLTQGELNPTAPCLTTACLHYVPFFYVRKWTWRGQRESNLSQLQQWTTWAITATVSNHGGWTEPIFMLVHSL